MKELQKVKKEFRDFKRRMQKWVTNVRYPKTCAGPYYYPNAKSGNSYSLASLVSVIDTADRLGYDVIMRNRSDGLNVDLVKRYPVPWDLT